MSKNLKEELQEYMKKKQFKSIGELQFYVANLLADLADITKLPPNIPKFIQTLNQYMDEVTDLKRVIHNYQTDHEHTLTRDDKDQLNTLTINLEMRGEKKINNWRQVIERETKTKQDDKPGYKVPFKGNKQDEIETKEEQEEKKEDKKNDFNL